MLGLIMFCLVCGALIFAMDSNSKAKMYKRALEEKIREEKDRKEKEAETKREVDILGQGLHGGIKNH